MICGVHVIILAVRIKWNTVKYKVYLKISPALLPVRDIAWHGPAVHLPTFSISFAVRTPLPAARSPLPLFHVSADSLHSSAPGFEFFCILNPADPLIFLYRIKQDVLNTRYNGFVPRRDLLRQSRCFSGRALLGGTLILE